MNPYEPEQKDDVASESENDVRQPPLYRVLLLNDDYTTMEFVIEILVQIFRKTQSAAEQIMLKVHREGVGLCGVYPYEIAETKVDTVHHLARENGFPLRCIMEKDES
ncbi:MAG: ATP-dependent Clp protease adapter ClpS [Deltaproteobacteria bacterium]|nr:MAG: ATP-dependent Clp protease adapter ClpS [Deltaproteobacteria bacterium]